MKKKILIQIFTYQTQKNSKNLFNEIKGRIKLDDESLPYKDYDMNIGPKQLLKEIIQLNLEKKLEQ